jgi:hypothetical protein
MNKLIATNYFLLTLFLIVFSSNAFALPDLPDSIIANGSQISTLEAFRTGSFTSFSYVTTNSFFEDISGNLHLVLIENYKLFYYNSTNDGETWQKNQIITGHEGDLRNATITVDTNGVIFIGITVHPDYNYAYPSGVYSGGEFLYEIYCLNNKIGAWQIESVAGSDAGSNAGPVAETIFVDSNNDVHFIAGRYGWLSYGGSAWEWIRNSSTDTWGSLIQIVEFTDAGIDKFINDNYIILTDSYDRKALVAVRTKSDGFKLFYVKNDGSGWDQPVELSDNIAVAWNRFDAVLSPSGTAYIAYLYNNNQGLPELKASGDFSPPITINLNLAATDTLNYFKLHCNAEGLFTMYLWIKNKNVHITFSDDFINWTDPIEVSAAEKNIVGGLMVRTDTRRGYFTKYAKQILTVAGQRTTQPYGPDTLFYGNVRLESATAVENDLNLPFEFDLCQNYPNPFNPISTIQFSIPETQFVTLKVFDLLGNEIATLVNEEKTAGSYKVDFNTIRHNISSGIYFYTLQAGSFKNTKKMVLLK